MLQHLGACRGGEILGDKNVFVRNGHAFQRAGGACGDFFVRGAGLRQCDLAIDVQKGVVRVAAQARQKPRGHFHCAEIFLFQTCSQFGNRHVV